MQSPTSLKCSVLFITFIFVHIISSLHQTSSASICNPNDKKVLLEIKHHFNNASVFTTWDANTNCCSNWSGIQCDVYGHVITLDVSIGDDIVGEIPPSLGELPYLQTLTFNNFPHLSSPIPRTIVNLTNLQHLDLSFNNLTGLIPDFFSQLKGLEYLDLGSNSFTGPIPVSLGQLHRLKLVSLDTNHLTGHIPSFFGFMNNLEELYLLNNHLSGSIPSSLSQLPKLFALNLGLNQLTGSIPASFGSFKTPLINYFAIYNNKLSGPIPASFGKANVTELYLYNNKFTGDASFLFSRDKTALTSIDMDHNLFSFDLSNVDLPQSLANFDVSHNKIFGSLPKRLGQLPLKSIDVSFNQLCGKIPTGRRLKQFSPSVFSNNKCLCGPPLAPCNN